MHLMERIDCVSWLDLSSSQRKAKLSGIRSIREAFRREAASQPTKTAIKRQAKRVKSPAEIKTKVGKRNAAMKALSKLTPEQKAALLKSYGVSND